MTLKPGTRCGCQSHMCNPGKDGHRRGGCPRAAVRLVTVHSVAQVDDVLRALATNATEAPIHEELVPMCEPCAAFHESKVANG